MARLELDKAAGLLLLSPDNVSPQSAQEEDKLEGVRQLCADLSLRSVSLTTKGRAQLENHSYSGLQEEVISGVQNGPKIN